jgi:39S ribosomal protein L53/MRP-L53
MNYVSGALRRCSTPLVNSCFPLSTADRMLKHLNHIRVRLSPLLGTSRSAREFLARVTAPKAKASNPDCIVEVRIRTQGEPYVQVTYSQGTIDRIPTSDLTCQQVVAKISTTTQVRFPFSAVCCCFHGRANLSVRFVGYPPTSNDYTFGCSPGIGGVGYPEAEWVRGPENHKLLWARRSFQRESSWQSRTRRPIVEGFSVSSRKATPSSERRPFDHGME